MNEAVQIRSKGCEFGIGGPTFEPVSLNSYNSSELRTMSPMQSFARHNPLTDDESARLDSFLFGLMVGSASLLESRGSVLEELLLPAIEHRRLEPQFVRSEIGILSTNADSEWRLFLPACSASVAFSCVRSVILTDERFLHFQLRQNNSDICREANCTLSNTSSFREEAPGQCVK